ncbi:MAG: mannosyltransferase family protein [Negativicutes bacterium]|nr:mannosyltransferase family protein [Negativicutes bacterium]
MMSRLLPSRAVWLAFFLHCAVVGVALVLAQFLPQHETLGFVNPDLPAAPPLIENFIRWDAQWYTYIAEHGYTQQTIVFFPGLPALIRAVSYLGLNTAVAGFAVCNLCSFISFSLLYRLCRLDYPESVSRRALLAYAVLPTAFFLNSIYTEALFIVCSLASIYFARTGRWWWAGMFAAAATLTRNLGLCLIFPLLYEYMYGRRPRKALPGAAFLLLAPLALFAYMAYNYSLTGDPIAFVHSQRLWGREFGWPWNNIAGNIRLIFSPDWTVVPGTILDSVTVPAFLAGLLTLTLSTRLVIQESYLILGWLWLLIPLFSSTPAFPLYSMSRFVLVIFPFYLFVAQLPRGSYRCYIAVSAILMLLCTALFVNWYWIG